jgi:uncharacterized protein YndB with AHSA1/START domain
MMISTPVVKEIMVKAPASRVWKAITHPEDMKIWYFDLPGFKAEVGYEFQFYGEAADGTKYLHLCKITEVVVNQKISYTWKYQGYTGESLVSFELVPDGENTLVRLIHSGLENFSKEEKDLKKENFDAGWESIIRESLKNYVEHN